MPAASNNPPLSGVLLVGNDHIVDILGVKDKISGDDIEAAQVFIHIKKDNASEADVDGAVWPIEAQSIGEGNFRANIDDGVELVAGRKYIVEVRVEAPGDLVGLWRFVVKAEHRRP